MSPPNSSASSSSMFSGMRRFSLIMFLIFAAISVFVMVIYLLISVFHNMILRRIGRNVSR